MHLQLTSTRSRPSPLPPGAASRPSSQKPPLPPLLPLKSQTKHQEPPPLNSQAKHRHCGVRLDLGGVVHGSPAGGHAAAQQAHLGAVAIRFGVGP